MKGCKISSVLLFSLLPLSLKAQLLDSFEVFFNTNEAKLEVNVLQETQKQLAKYNLDSQKVLIYGYTDKMGDAKSNLTLAQERADFAKNLLADYAPNVHIRMVAGRGEDTRADQSKPDQKGRRAVIYFLEKIDKNKVTSPVVTPKPPKGKVLELEKLKVNEYGAIDLPNINFFADDIKILPSSYENVELLINTVLAHPTMKFEIHGHICCDTINGYDPGSIGYRLSVARAQVIYEMLVKAGVPRGNMTYKGFGVSQPLYTDYSKEKEIKLNRRVSIKILNR